VVLVIFAMGWLLLFGRSAWLAVGPDDRLAARTAGQHERIITVAPQRGSIVDRMGRPLAISVELGSIYADPALVEDADSAAELLAPLLDRDLADLQERLGRDGSRFVWLGRQLPPTVTDRIAALDIPGVRVTPESHREYPSGPVAGPILGFVNIEGVGLEGLEARHDSTLMGDKFQYRVLRDGHSRATNHAGVLARRGTEGRTLVLTLDHSIQHRAEAALESAIDRHEAEAGWIVTLDAKSGAILALAAYPDYDPNQYRKVSADRRRNRGISEVFEPGSTMKPFVFAEVLERGLASEDEELYLEKGRYKVGRRTIRDAHAHDRLSVADILKLSSNIGTAKLAERIGPKGLEEVYRRFGFGAKTGIDLSGEERGLLSPSENWSRIGFANRAFGQGVGVTGVQLTAAFAALVNGGVAVRPHIVAEIRDSAGGVEDLRPPLGERVISEETSATMRRLLARVLEDGGTGVRARPLEYIAGGKTGTAQKVVDGRYAQNVYVSSFIGFAPVRDPRVVTLVVLDEPKNEHYGGTVAGPAFAEVTTHALRVLGVAPDQTAVAPLLLSPDLEAELAERSGRELPRLTPTPEGDAWSLPDLTGWSARDVVQVLLPAGARVEIEGSGLVRDQSPAPGARVTEGDVITLALGPTSVPGSNRRTQ
jgi:cell division protein FtsI (penicillin-binding protein 3)